MRRYLYIIAAAVVCLILPDGAAAQRALPGMRGLEVRGGAVDGFSSSTDSKTGFYFGAAMTSYARNANKWVFGVEYLNRYYPYKNGRIPVAQFTGEGGYYKKFLSDGSKTFFCSLGGSALMGYETVNWGEKLLYDGSTIQNPDRFLYGGAVTLEIEAYVTDKIVLLFTARERVLWGTTTGHFHTQVGVGVRFMIN